MIPRIGKTSFMDHRRYGTRWNAGWGAGFSLKRRRAIRALVRSPGLAVVGVVTLGLGIAGTVTLFSFVKGVYLEPLPYSNPQQLMAVYSIERESESRRDGLSFPDLQDVASEASLLAGVAAYRSQEMILSRGDRPLRIHVTQTTTNALDLLGIQLQRGRGFAAQDGEAGAAPVALISQALYEGRGGGDVLSESLYLDGTAFTVVGVLPRGFAFLRTQPDVLIPFNIREHARHSDRSDRFLAVFARLKSEIELNAARQELSNLAGRLSQAYPDTNGHWGLDIEPLQHVLRPSRDVRAAMAILSVTLALVLLVSCANVANLLLARIHRREAELAVRSALGAGLGRLSLSLLLESTILALGGGLLGLMLGTLGVRGVIASIPVGNLSIFDFDLDLKAVGFTALVCGVTAIGTCLVPIVRVVSIDLARSLVNSSAGAGRGGGRWGKSLILIEVGVTFFLLVVSSVVLQSVQKMHHKELGFSPERLLTFRVDPRPVPYAGMTEVQNFYESLVRDLVDLPAVEAAGTVNDLTLTGADSRGRVLPEGHEDTTGVSISVRTISPGFFSALSVPIVAGRGLKESDDRSASPVVVVNRAWVNRWKPDGPVVGTRLEVLDQRPREIVGVVEDFYEVRLDRPIEPVVYLPEEQNPSRRRGLILRTVGEPTDQLASVLEKLRQIDPEQSVYAPRPMAELVERQAWVFKTTTKMLTVLTGLGLLMSMAGIFSVTTATVAQRIAEVGIRMAVGASRRSILFLILKECVKLSSIGVLLAAPLAYAATRLLSGVLYGVEAAGLPAIVLLAALVTATTLAATLAPAWRAANVHPMAAVRID
ncbi:MAG: ADOP family duplicated permease [Thermoanaerobaculia bacterium]|nr:ADOP family duplicated permease [Thermoanaerobaculia bacterium]